MTASWNLKDEFKRWGSQPALDPKKAMPDRHLFGEEHPEVAQGQHRTFTLLAAILLAVSLALVPTIAGPGPGQSSATPGSAEQDLQEVDRLMKANRLEEARDRLDQVIRAHGESYGTLFTQAQLLFREQKYADSLKVIERCLVLNQQDPEAYKLAASNAILMNRMDIAEKALKTAAGLAPDDHLVYFNLGALYYTDSRFNQAEPMLEKSVSLAADYVPARLFLGLTQEELGQEPAAIETYREAIRIAERSGFKGEQPYLYLGRLLYRQNKFDESLPYLQKAVKANPHSCESMCLLARVLMNKSRDSEASAALDQCRNADPRYPEVHYLLSRLFVKQGRNDKAAKELALFQTLKKQEQDKKDPRRNQRALQ